MAAEESTDSPAFRLRPRRGAPKQYYTVRLEYSANPAAFIRTERPRTGASKRKTANSNGRNRNRNGNINAGTGKYTKNAKTGSAPGPGPIDYQVPVVKTKEQREREERRKRLHRELSSSITNNTNTVISAFLQRKHLDELEPETIYKHEYIVLKILSQLNGTKFLGQDAVSELKVQVDLAKEFANEAMIVPGKFMNLGKFKTGPKIEPTISVAISNSPTGTAGHAKLEPDTPTQQLLPFEVIAKTTTITNPLGGMPRFKPIVPFVSITDKVDQPQEPYVQSSAGP